jgi:hypothetical protein
MDRISPFDSQHLEAACKVFNCLSSLPRVKISEYFVSFLPQPTYAILHQRGKTKLLATFRERWYEPLSEPDVANPHVRFDERDVETEYG